MAAERTRGHDEGSATADDRSTKPSAAEVRDALERILASRCFQQAGRASEFLRFVVEQTLAGGGQRLKGYTIGVEVFGRPADFDAQSDALVRVEAGRLRRRLVEYYATEGADDAVRIELPRGSYAAECRFARPDERAVASAEPVAASPQGTIVWRRTALGLATLLLAALGVIAWQHAALRAAAPAPVAAAQPQRTDLPRIVIVPFENLSVDPALGAFATSITEEVMVRLNQLDMFIVAMEAASSAGAGDRAADAAQAGSYVLTGSVRGGGAQVRVTARVMDAGTGEQLWTAAFDEALGAEQSAALPERVAGKVVEVAAPYGPIYEAELTRARTAADGPKLRDCLVTYQDYRRRVTPDGYEETLRCLESVSARKPDVAAVWAMLAMLHIDEYSSTFGRTGEQALEAARVATARALALDPDDFLANMALTRVQFFNGDPAFRRTIDRTIALGTHRAQALAQAGFLLVITGDVEQGLEMTERSRQLTPVPLGFYHLTYAAAYLRERRFDDALASALRVEAPNWVFAQAVLAAAAAQSGRHDIAQNAADQVRRLYPSFEAEALANFERWHFDPALYDALVNGLRAAGLAIGAGDLPVSGG